MNIGLVACAARKIDHTAPARELYVSPLFLKAAAYCEREYDRWFILSARHHLVPPDEVLVPYDLTLNTMGHLDRKAWTSRVKAQLCAQAGPISEQTFYLHAGKRYTEYLAPWLLESGATVVSPFPGLGIGQQLRWYLDRGIS